MWTPTPWVGYAVALAALARTAYAWWFGPEPAHLIPFLVPVVLAGWIGGFQCGLFATALNAFVAAYFFIEPLHSIGIARAGGDLPHEKWSRS